MKIKPFNFEALFEALENSLDYETYHQYKSLYLEMHKARWSAKKLYDYLNQNEFSNQEINYLNKQLHYIYLEIQECFVRLSWNGFSIFPHEAHQENIFQLREAIRLLKNQKVPEAIIELCKIDLNLFNYYYDKDTFDFYVNYNAMPVTVQLSKDGTNLLNGEAVSGKVEILPFNAVVVK